MASPPIDIRLSEKAQRRFPSSGLCSILVPTQNRRDRLLRTLACLQAQTYRDLEIVVSDDGSTDGTSEAVRSLEDARIRLVTSETPSGVAIARNRAASVARGRWLAVCDDDDLWTPTKVEHQVRAMAKASALWSYCYAAVVDDALTIVGEDRKPLDADFMYQMSSGNRIPGGCSTVIMERQLFARVGGFDPTFSMFADWDLWLRLAAIALPLAHERIECLYVQHGSQMSGRAQQSAEELAALRRKHEAHRRAHGVPQPEWISRWVAQRLWRDGAYRQALLVLLSPDPVMTLAGSAARIPFWLRRKVRPGPSVAATSLDAILARDSVSAILKKVPTTARLTA